MKMYEEETREVVDYREGWGILKDASEELQEEIVCLKGKIEGIRLALVCFGRNKYTVDLQELENALDETGIHVEEDKIYIGIPEMLTYKYPSVSVVQDYDKVKIGKAILNLKDSVKMYNNCIIKREFDGIGNTLIRDFLLASKKFQRAIYDYLK